MTSLLIAGLGNPGIKYHLTRHNIGFEILDSLAQSLNVKFENSRFNAEIVKIPSCNTFLVKPNTFMNLSGEAIVPIMNFYKIDSLLVVHDDLDLEFGCIKFKKAGSNGGHNGLKSIDSLFGNDYYRLRFGIGRDLNVVDYVLSKFTDIKTLKELIKHSQEALEFFMTTKDFTKMQNNFTQKALKV